LEIEIDEEVKNEINIQYAKINTVNSKCNCSSKHHIVLTAVKAGTNLLTLKE